MKQIRETQRECQDRVVLEVIPTVADKPISLGELTKVINDKIPYSMYKLSPVEVSSKLRIVKEYKRFTSCQGSGATEYIFIKWRRPRPRWKSI